MTSDPPAALMCAARLGAHKQLLCFHFQKQSTVLEPDKLLNTMSSVNQLLLSSCTCYSALPSSLFAALFQQPPDASAEWEY